jgi:hypothetical protein
MHSKVFFVLFTMIITTVNATAIQTEQAKAGQITI